MIRVTLEVRSGISRFKASVWAESIAEALSAAEVQYPGARTSVLFPIEPEYFFVLGAAPIAGTVVPAAPEEVAG